MSTTYIRLYRWLVDGIGGAAERADVYLQLSMAQVGKDFYLSLTFYSYSKPNICQDRLGTDIGKDSPKRERFLAVAIRSAAGAARTEGDAGPRVARLQRLQELGHRRRVAAHLGALLRPFERCEQHAAFELLASVSGL